MKIVPFIAILFFHSCNNKEFDVATVKKHIIDLTTEYNKVWETLDVEKIADFHSDETFLYYWHGELASADNAHFKKLFRDILSSLKSWSVKKTSAPLVQVLNKNATIISFTLEAEVIGLDGKKTTEAGALTYVWSKASDKWKLIHIHDSPK